MTNQNETIIWRKLREAGCSEPGAAGVLGNLYAESGLNPQNLQDTFERKLGMLDYEYTAAVDGGVYANFVHDGAGYGLAQWTWWSRKQALLEYAQEHGTSIGDLEMQTDFLIRELDQWGLLGALKTVDSVRGASNLILLQFEKPADQSERMQDIRAEYSQAFYDQLKEESPMGNFTNSPLAVCRIISPNRNSPREHAIDRITIHCVVGQCSAEALGNLFTDPGRYASSNYGVDKDGRVGIYVDECDRSWCSSSRDNDDRAITIETASDTFHPYAVTDAAYRGLIDLCEDICRRNGKKKLIWFGDKDKTLAYDPQPDEMIMTVHRWFANKACPGQYLMDRQAEIAAEVTRRLQEEDEDMMNLDRFTELMNEYRETLRDNDAGAWSEDARRWAVENGLIVGGGDVNGEPNYMFEDLLTREQMVVLLYRFAKLMGKA